MRLTWSEKGGRNRKQSGSVMTHSFVFLLFELSLVLGAAKIGGPRRPYFFPGPSDRSVSFPSGLCRQDGLRWKDRLRTGAPGPLDRGPGDGSQGGGGINFRGDGSRLESRRSPPLEHNPLCRCHPDGFHNYSHHPAAPGKKA